MPSILLTFRSSWKLATVQTENFALNVAFMVVTTTMWNNLGGCVYLTLMVNLSELSGPRLLYTDLSLWKPTNQKLNQLHWAKDLCFYSAYNNKRHHGLKTVSFALSNMQMLEVYSVINNKSWPKTLMLTSSSSLSASPWAVWWLHDYLRSTVKSLLQYLGPFDVSKQKKFE